MNNEKIIRLSYEEADWKKMYLKMVDAAENSIEMINRGEYFRAAAQLIEALNICEDMYIEAGECSD